MPEIIDDMKDSWFFDENFNGVSDEFFKEANFFDFSMEDLEASDQVEDLEASDQVEDWNALLQPSLDSFSASLSTHCGRRVDNPKVRKFNSPKDERTYQQVSSSGSSDVKPSQPRRTSSPISVLESGNSCSAESKPEYELPLSFPRKLSTSVRRARSKRPRPSTIINAWLRSSVISNVSHFNADTSFSKAMVQLNKRKENKKKKKNLSQLSKVWLQDTGEGKKCSHCEVTKTPQWREGPLGPKSLCNACGVRYRSGRLFPEYRPAASPSFVSSLHSNSHRKVTEMRNKATQMKNKEIIIPPQNKSIPIWLESAD